VTAGAAAPQVTVVSPNGGETLGGATATVTWTATDSDGDELWFNLQYSADDGASWETVAQAIQGSSAEIETANMPSTTTGRFRVWASDGIHATYDASDGVFTVPNHVPQIAISSPVEGATVAISQTVAFGGSAYDPDTGTMEAAQLSWTSDRDGALGQGSSLSLANLSVGAHTITFRADDGVGGVATATVHVTVVADPTGLPVANGLQVSPGSIRFEPQGGVVAATLDVTNQNDAVAITWNATADQDWIQLGAVTGTTAAQLHVTYHDTGLDSGELTGLIALTSPQVPGQTVYVNVEAVFPSGGLWLPLVLRM
jgi:hypothetical protein